MRTQTTTQPSSLRVLQQGFTIIELLIVVAVFTIIAAISVDATGDYQLRARDTERAADARIIASAMERYYRTQPAANGATYPSATTVVTSTNASLMTMAKIVDEPEAVTAPNQTSPSIDMATTSGDKTPTINQYIYQAMNVDGTICNTAPCVKFELYYRLEDGSVIKSIDSLRQQ
jgi:prepilin-type N-terminal cleavage/methylation domain-containing protein